MPDTALLSPLGQQMRAMLPPVVRDSPDHLAQIHAAARELDLLEASIEQVRSQFNPNTADVALYLWERLVRATENPVGQTLAQRRATVVAFLQQTPGDARGVTWQQRITNLIGPGWSYEEHQPGVGTSPPEGTIRITLPFPPSGSAYAQAERLIRKVTADHLALIFLSSTGFLLDESEMDIEGMHY